MLVEGYADRIDAPFNDALARGRALVVAEHVAAALRRTDPDLAVAVVPVGLGVDPGNQRRTQLSVAGPRRGAGRAGARGVGRGRRFGWAGVPAGGQGGRLAVSRFGGAGGVPMSVSIGAFGHALGSRAVTNDDLGGRFGLSPDDIERRTGIRERRYADGGGTSDLVVAAARMGFEQSESPDDVDCVIVATGTPDRRCPSCAALVHQKLGTRRAAGFDVFAACSGFVYALDIGWALMQARGYECVLIAGAETMSTVVDPTDRRTVLLFGDGAGTALLRRGAEGGEILDVACWMDSDRAEDVVIPQGGSLRPAGEGGHTLRFGSRSVAADGVAFLCRAAQRMLDRNGLSVSDLDLVVPHQANGRMLDAVARRLALRDDQLARNVDRVGNTSAASISILPQRAEPRGPTPAGSSCWRPSGPGTRPAPRSSTSGHERRHSPRRSRRGRGRRPGDRAPLGDGARGPTAQRRGTSGTITAGAS